jgi:hypothetical protein
MQGSRSLSTTGQRRGPLQSSSSCRVLYKGFKRLLVSAASRQQPGSTRRPAEAASSSAPDSSSATGRGNQQPPPPPPSRIAQRAAAALCAAAVVLAPLPGAPLGFLDPAVAANAAKVGTCLLSKCQVALARCLADGPCLQNLVCLNLCNGDPDETGCQIRCGDQ